MTSVLIVVLNWNGIDDTEKCIASLSNQIYKDFKIAIVDNGSKDSSLTRLENLVNNNKKLILIKNETNLGFAGGVNSGIKHAIDNKFDAVALLNNDAVAEKDWLENLVDKLEPGTGIVTGLLLRSNGETIDGSGDFYSSWGVSFPRSRNQPADNAPESGFVFGATGGGSLYRTSLFKKIGFFDETFFLYYEDSDISFRSQLAGYKTFYSKEAIAYHKEGASSKKMPGLAVYHMFKNLPLLFWKNIPTKLLFRVGFRFFLLYTLIFGNAIKNGSGKAALRGVISSVWYFWTSALWKRLKIQRGKQVTADYIWSILYHDLPPEQTGMRKFRKLFTGK